jgi:alkanesulfonate monooxygenase SsuD/methylene tetrahydromethanopterin reductase-like flavin-dependent oxidoreductase (luciferase family)
MKVSLALDLGSPTATPAERLAHASALLADAAPYGFDTVWIGETYVRVGRVPMHLPGSLTVLAALIDRTAFRLGTGVLLLPAWNPVKLAYETALLDQLSGGRLTLGVGIGRAALQQRFGLESHHIAATTDATLVALKQLWTGSFDPMSVRTRVARELGGAQDGGIWPLPVQADGPPILVGGSVRNSVVRAARLGDGWYASTSYGRSLVASQAAAYRTALVDVGFTQAERPTVVANRLTVVGETASVARRLARRHAGAILSLYQQWGSLDRLGLPTMPPPALYDAIGPDFCLVGTPDDVVTQLEAYAALGVTHAALRVTPAEMPLTEARRTIRLVGRHVIDAVRDL